MKKYTPSSPIPSRPTTPKHGTEYGTVSSACGGGVATHQPVIAEVTRTDIEVDLAVVKMPHKSTVQLRSPFSIEFSLAVSWPVDSRKSETGSLLVQHVVRVPIEELKRLTSESHNIKGLEISLDSAAPLNPPRSPSIDAITPRQVLSPGPGTPGGSTTRGFSSPELVTSPAMAPASLSQILPDPLTDRLRLISLDDTQRSGAAGNEMGENTGLHLLPPFAVLPQDELVNSEHSGGQVRFIGSSTVSLPRLPSNNGMVVGGRVEEENKFTLSYMPTRQGFARIGGLRLWLLRDERRGDTETFTAEPRMLKEWDIVSEVWVT